MTTEKTTIDDRWQLIDMVGIGESKARVSTVELPIAHGPTGDLAYETCVFYNGKSRVVDRYQRKSQARKGHKNVRNELKNDLVNLPF